MFRQLLANKKKKATVNRNSELGAEYVDLNKGIQYNLYVRIYEQDWCKFPLSGKHTNHTCIKSTNKSMHRYSILRSMYRYSILKSTYIYSILKSMYVYVLILLVFHHTRFFPNKYFFILFFVKVLVHTTVCISWISMRNCWPLQPNACTVRVANHVFGGTSTSLAGLAAWQQVINPLVLTGCMTAGN
jgi:hypothetical protein